YTTLFRSDAVSQPTRLDHFRGDDGIDPPFGPGRARRLGRVVHHGGCRSFAANAEGGVLGSVHRPILRPWHHAADVRVPEEPAIPVVLRGNPDPQAALAGSAPLAPGSA